MTPKQKRFADEYILDLNATQAAIRAGYSPKTAGSQGERLLRYAEINEYLAVQIKDRAERTKVDSDYVLQRLVEIDQMDIADILDENGALIPLSQWPSSWRRYISALDLSELYDGRGDGRQATGALKKIKWPDKLKNLELIGKHVDVHAFSERVDIGIKEQPIHNLSNAELERIAMGDSE